MNTYKSSAQLKSLAKGQLLGKYSTTIGAIVLSEVIMLVLSFVLTMFLSTGTAFGLILNYIIRFLVGLFSGVFAAGSAYIYLNICCKRPVKASDIFYGFTQHPDKALLLQLILSAITSAALLPSDIISHFFLRTNQQDYIFPLCILLIIGSIISVYFSLVFSQVYYLLLDFPDYTVKQILHLGKSIMKGHKARLFYITISFLPLYLLGLLSCGIGILWVMPYVNATMANFYLDLMKNRQTITV